MFHLPNIIYVIETLFYKKNHYLHFVIDYQYVIIFNKFHLLIK